MISVLSSGFQWICAVITVISIRNSVQSERPNTKKDILEAVCVGGQEETRWEARKSARWRSGVGLVERVLTSREFRQLRQVSAIVK